MIRERIRNQGHSSSTEAQVDGDLMLDKALTKVQEVKAIKPLLRSDKNMKSDATATVHDRTQKQENDK